MKYFLMSIASLCVSVSVYASHYSSNLEGNYNCHGTEVGTNESFTCAMMLKKTGQTYSLKSTCNDGTSYIGTGIYDHNKRNLSLVFINPKNSKETGVIIAEVKRDYAMTSTWTYLHNTSVGHGACRRDKGQVTP